MAIKVAIIGGTGLDCNIDIISNYQELPLMNTPFGRPSDTTCKMGQINDVDVIIMSRHGLNHDICPSKVNYRANIWTIKQLKCTHIIATTACGSLNIKMKPGDFAILDQYIDRTCGRKSSFYQVAHINQAHPFDLTMQKVIEAACNDLDYVYHSKATVLADDGPRYTSISESKLYQSWKCDLINMTTVPEAPLAAELGLIYSALALITDYDVCFEWAEDVSVEVVDKAMIKFQRKVHNLLIDIIKKTKLLDWTDVMKRKASEAEKAILAR